MVVQNFSPIRCFPHNKRPPKVRGRTKKKNRPKKKKEVGKPIGDPVGGRDAPIGRRRNRRRKRKNFNKKKCNII